MTNEEKYLLALINDSGPLQASEIRLKPRQGLPTRHAIGKTLRSLEIKGLILYDKEDTSWDTTPEGENN